MGQRQDAEAVRCPCGSDERLVECCGPLLSGERVAVTAEQLMRSRYTANVYANTDYLTATWHLSTRPLELHPERAPVLWTGLKVVRSVAGGEEEIEGMVEFVAHYRSNGRDGVLHEVSSFVKEDGRWYYLDGVISDEMRTDETGRQDKVKGSGKIGRNAPCPCGSGRKYKQCCGRR